MEEFRVVGGTDGAYCVSSLGQVKSHKGLDPKGRILRSPRNSCGYLIVGIDGRTRHVHKLVAEAFIGPCPSGFVVHHKNNDRGDARVQNLEYISNRENVTLGKRLKSGVKSKHPGVYERRLRNGQSKYKVQKYAKGKRNYVGLFDDLDAAISAYESYAT